jgi:hypothetical protein
MLGLKHGLVWDQTAQKGVRADRFQLAVAVVGDISTREPSKFDAIRIYFGTWSVTDGKPRLRVGPIAPLEREDTDRVIETAPTLRKYFDCLARGDAAIGDQFEEDGYFREPANNYCCGRDQLSAHFEHVLELGGVGVEFLTGLRTGNHLAFEVQTVKWGSKTMPQPQAGFASYDLGPHGKLQGARVYDSVVPPI